MDYGNYAINLQIMKYIFFPIIFLISLFNTTAQVTLLNEGFENWPASGWLLSLKSAEVAIVSDEPKGNLNNAKTAAAANNKRRD